MEEELSSIWTVLIRAGLSAALQAKRFTSSVAEEKHICHKSLGLPDGGGGFWSEILGWWGYGVRWLLPSLALRAVGSWCPSEDYRQKKKIKSLHCIAACLGGAQREILQGATSGHGHHSSYCLSSEQSAICTPSLPVQMCSMPSGLKCQELFYQTLR